MDLTAANRPAAVDSNGGSLMDKGAGLGGGTNRIANDDDNRTGHRDAAGGGAVRTAECEGVATGAVRCHLDRRRESETEREACDQINKQSGKQKQGRRDPEGGRSTQVRSNQKMRGLLRKDAGIATGSAAHGL